MSIVSLVQYLEDRFSEVKSDFIENLKDGMDADEAKEIYEFEFMNIIYDGENEYNSMINEYYNRCKENSEKEKSIFA